MTLRMGDGPVANLPGGLDAYAGYTDKGGIGITFPSLVLRFPNALHLSISVHGLAPAMCGDVENGALSSWVGYDYGYTSISNAQAMINRYGRPKKLWTAHYDPSLGPHICSKSIPKCAEFGFEDQADGTQWTDHGNVWDESLLADDFFVLAPPKPPAPPIPPNVVILEEDVIRETVTVATVGGKGWCPVPPNVSNVISCVPIELPPDQVRTYTAVPGFAGVTGNRELVFGSGPFGPPADGTWSFLLVGEPA